MVVPFVAESAGEVGSGSVLDLGAVYRRIEELAAASAPCIAIRIDGVFPWLRLRSVRRQRPPYRPLAAALADQVEFELHDVEATVVGFRFPVEAQGVEVAGYHLHAATADRTRGGHVLDLSLAEGRIEIDPASDLHLELPPGVELTNDTGGATRDLLERLEGATGR